MKYLYLLLLVLGILLLCCEKDFSSLKNQPNGPDTTSHNFSWRIDTLGIGGSGSSYLLDVAIIDENDIWAVGEIHTQETDRFDSLGVWQPPFNAVHWNGQEWDLKRIPAVTSYGTIARGPINAVYAFSKTDIWMFSKAGSYAQWDGNQWRSEYVTERQGGIRRIWGTSRDNIYFVGTNGSITYKNGDNWTLLNSGTTVDIQDIWGARNVKTGKEEIIALASNGIQTHQGKSILQISGSEVSVLNDKGLPLALSSIWFVPEVKYFAVGDGGYQISDFEAEWQKINDQPSIYKSAIRGNHINDIIICGGYGLVSHFNGNDWFHYQNIELPTFFGTYGALDFKFNDIAAVGWIDNLAIILRGKR